MLDYSIPSFQFLIGNFDCTNYLDSIDLSLPIHEPSQPLIWSGRFKISRNLAAVGLGDAQFDQFYTPQLWRPYQQLVRLRLHGYDLPALRIERYGYNPQTKTGEGILTQLLTAGMTDRPATEPDVAVDRRSIADTATLLINKAFEGATIPAPGAQIALNGDIYGGITTRNPIADAQRLCATNWRWLVVDEGEVIRWVSGNPSDRPLSFTRTLDEVEWEPDLDGIDFAASKVIVTGSRQVPDPVNCDGELNSNLDGQARPKVQKTQEQQASKLVFSSSTSTDPVLAERKWIFYQYEDDPNLHGDSVGLIPVDLLFDIQTQATPRNVAQGQPYQTITIKQWPAGRIFEALGTNTTMYTAEISIQNEVWRAIYKPRGAIDESAGQDFTLILEKREDLTTTPVLGNPDGGQIDPLTGNPLCLVPRPVEEPRQVRPEIPLKTVPVRGEAVVLPAGWTPILPRVYAIDLGFIPSDAHATNLANQIAQREERRRNAVQVTMPLPIEWLAAGCTPLARCAIGDRTLQIDGPIIQMSDGEARFSFSGGTVSQGGIAIARQMVEIPIFFRVEISIESKIRSSAIEGTSSNGDDFDLEGLDDNQFAIVLEG
jgi:hypothetical protein